MPEIGSEHHKDGSSRHPAIDRETSALGSVLGHLADPLFRHGYTLIVNTGLTSALGIVYWVLAARLYRADQVGVNASVISSLVFLSGLAQLNLRPVLSRFIPVAGRRTARLALGSYASALLVAALAAVVFLFGSSIWASGGPIPIVRSQPLLAAIFVGGTMLWTIFSLQDGILVGLRATIWLVIENVVFGIAKIAVIVALATWPDARDIAIVASWLAPMVVAVAVVNLLMFRSLVPSHVRARPESSALVTAPRIARFAAADYLGSLFALTYIALLPVIIIDQVGVKAGGQFYIVWVIASSLQLVAPQLTASLTVETAADPSTFRRQGRRTLIGLLRILVPVCLLVALLAPSILSIFGEAYVGEAGFLRLLVLAIIPQGINSLYVGLARIALRPRRIIAMQVALAALILSMSLLLVGPLGLEGVGLAFLIGQTAVAVVALATALRPLLVREHEAAPARVPGRSDRGAPD
ncbi:MAG: hypothetical protein H0U52_17045 [Chloroflexi bacterium]|nr:hypothetical protein [Chloroflexota bacterium]